MSTPASLKRMEEAKQKAQQRKSTGLQPLGGQVLAPLSNNTSNNFTSYRTKNIDFTDDNFTKGRQYTSFEANRVKKPVVKRNNTKAIVVPPKAVEIPLGLATDDYVVDSKKIVCFNGKDHFLSTLYPSAIMIDNHKYLSVEHYYQACKLFSLAGSEHAARLRNVTEPTRAKITAKNILRELNVSTSKIDDWKAAQGILMLIHATAYKFVQNLELRKKLIDTGDAILAQSYDRDTFYACGADKEAVMKWAVENDGQVIKIPSELSLDNMKYVPLVGQGRNVLGVICMKIRKQILDGLSEQKVITVEMFLPPIMNALSMSSVNVAGEQESEEIDINIPRDAILAQSYDRDTFYACGADKEAVMKWAVENDGQVIKIPSELSLDNMKYVPLVGQGRNVLGVICMKIRKQILDGLSEQKVITVEMFLPPIMNALSMSSVNVAGEQESEEIDINIPRDAILAQSYDRDTFYACGADKEAVMKWAVENDGQVIKIPSELSLDNMKYVPLVGQGRNVLGVICMKIRKQILDGLSEQKVITVEMFLPPIMNALSMSSVNVAGEQESEEIDINIPSLSLS